MNFKTIERKSLEELEKDYWQSLNTYPTPLIKTLYEARKKKLKDLTSNEIRILLSQNVGSKYLISIAIEVLKRNVLEETLFYPGDLLMSVLKLSSSVWQENITAKKELKSILNKEIPLISKSRLINQDIKTELVSEINKFIKA